MPINYSQFYTLIETDCCFLELLTMCELCNINPLFCNTLRD